jgi:subtilisin family serine protease
MIYKKLPHSFKNLCFLMIAFIFILGACTNENGDVEMAQDLDGLQSGTLIEGKYIVVFNEGAIDKTSFSSSKDFGSRQLSMRKATARVLDDLSISSESIDITFSNVIDGFSASLNREDLTRLEKDPRVKYIEQDRIITLNQGGRPGGGGGGSTSQTTPWGITRVGGAVNYTGSNVAWILDTGIQLDHPDLNVDVARSVTMFTSGKDAKDGNDGNGHGTHVAGTIAAINNSIGVVGVAAGATTIAVKVLDSRGSGSYSGVIAGVDHVGANAKAGDVANMSLGGPASQALDDAVLRASNRGIWFSLAAGNDSRDANTTSPARVNGPYIVTISAMDSNDRFASFSNWGNPPVDWCAPGVSINSTWISSGYRSISGTSMAAPHAAGILLSTGGTIRNGGSVQNDPDGKPDPISVR